MRAPPTPAGAPADAFAPERRRLGPGFWIGASWVTLMVLVALFAHQLPFKNPDYENFALLTKNPSGTGPTLHDLLGTDDNGRDLLARIVYGSRVTLTVSFGAVAIGLVLGGVLGMLAAYWRGWFDHVCSAIAFVLVAFPSLLAILVVVAFWGHAVWKLTVIFAVAAVPQFFILVRASALSMARREFVVATRVLGARAPRIVVRELLPNLLPVAISFALIGVATVAIAEGALAYLGQSVPPPTPTIGGIIAEGVPQLQANANPWICVFPAIYLFLLLGALFLTGDSLRRFFDLREVKL